MTEVAKHPTFEEIVTRDREFCGEPFADYKGNNEGLIVGTPAAFDVLDADDCDAGLEGMLRIRSCVTALELTTETEDGEPVASTMVIFDKLHVRWWKDDSSLLKVHVCTVSEWASLSADTEGLRAFDAALHDCFEERWAFERLVSVMNERLASVMKERPMTPEVLFQFAEWYADQAELLDRDCMASRLEWCPCFTVESTA